MTDTQSTTTVEEASRNWVRIGVGLLGVVVMAAAFTIAETILAGIVATLRAAVDNDYLLLMVVGGVAMAFAILVFLTDRDSVQLLEPPEVERPTPAPEPGEPFDDELERWSHWVPLLGRKSRASIQTRLREAAVQAVKLDRDVPEDDAERLVATGSWTSDPVAAAFLSEGGSGVNPIHWVAAPVHGETPVGYRTRRAMEAIANIHGDGADAR